MFAVLSKRECKKPSSCKITSNQLMSEGTSYRKGECCFCGEGGTMGKALLFPTPSVMSYSTQVIFLYLQCKKKQLSLSCC